LYSGVTNTKPSEAAICAVHFLHHLMFVSRAAWHCRGHGLIEERHREVSEIEKPAFNRFSFVQLLKNPLRRLFGKPALTCAADDH
jgi:hypothetical protein